MCSYVLPFPIYNLSPVTCNLDKLEGQRKDAAALSQSEDSWILN